MKTWVCGFIRSNRGCLSEWGCVLIYIPIKCCFSSKPHKMLHVVSVHSHCFEFLVVVIYWCYFSKSNSCFSTVNITWPYRGSCRESPGCGAITHLELLYRARALTFIAHESRCHTLVVYCIVLEQDIYTLHFQMTFPQNFFNTVIFFFFSIIDIFISKPRNMNGLFLDKVKSSGSSYSTYSWFTWQRFFIIFCSVSYW